jgi:hypothetical protein
MAAARNTVALSISEAAKLSKEDERLRELGVSASRVSNGDDDDPRRSLLRNGEYSRDSVLEASTVRSGHELPRGRVWWP